MRQISILGATGSIGENALRVIENHRDQFSIYALTAHQNVTRMFELCCIHTPKFAVMSDEACAQQLKQQLKLIHSPVEVLAGEAALIAVVENSAVDIIIAAIVGAVGLPPILAAAKQGKRILLASKEALVMAGQLLMQISQENNATILPIDSEHNAILQCLPSEYVPGQPLPSTVDSIILTASGGPFLNTAFSQLKSVTPQQALQHPNWRMGPKVTIDSATMMNKGLEIIEAHFLFQAQLKQIEVIIHPQSVIHSLVNYRDGSFLAQMGVPDMRIPIAYALSWPNRIYSNVEKLDLIAIKNLTFAAVDYQRYPCLQLAYQALKTGGNAMTILNAANEIAVQSFLQKQISFIEISSLIDQTLQDLENNSINSLEDIFYWDQQARFQAMQLLKQFA